jgi:hypothetical protein
MDSSRAECGWFSMDMDLSQNSTDLYALLDAVIRLDITTIFYKVGPREGNGGAETCAM